MPADGCGWFAIQTGFTDDEIAAYNQLHLIPFNRAFGQHCELLPDPLTKGEFMEQCRAIREFPPHHYESIDDQMLRQLAEHDAVAALVLGQRTVKDHERARYYITAAALCQARPAR